ncbi:MAG: hypothetical protein U0637_02875 [Phycisphaerales bacterium]
MHGLLATVLGVLVLLAGCSTGRLARLERKADRIEDSLRSEQKRVLALGPGDPGRAARLDYLSQLRGSLSAANVARGTVPYIIEEPQRPIAYDVLEEVYSTIEWNIPLGPNDPARKAMPSQFSGNSLQLK